MSRWVKLGALVEWEGNDYYVIARAAKQLILRPVVKGSDKIAWDNKVKIKEIKNEKNAGLEIRHQIGTRALQERTGIKASEIKSTQGSGPIVSGCPNGACMCKSSKEDFVTIKISKPLAKSLAFDWQPCDEEPGDDPMRELFDNCRKALEEQP
jgi:hypothetical protein